MKFFYHSVSQAWNLREKQGNNNIEVKVLSFNVYKVKTL